MSAAAASRIPEPELDRIRATFTGAALLRPGVSALIPHLVDDYRRLRRLLLLAVPGNWPEVGQLPGLGWCEAEELAEEVRAIRAEFASTA